MFLKSKLSENRHEVKDVVYLVVFQGLNYVPSLIVLPYLIVVLGAEKFGHIGFSLAVCQILMIVVDFGFNLSASKRIAVVREDKAAVDRIFAAAFYCRLGLLLLCFAVIAAISYVPRYEIYRPALFAKSITVVGEAFLFTFLFQGMGKIRWVSIFYCIAKFLMLPVTFLLVKAPDDYLWAAALPGFVTILADIMLVCMIISNKWVRMPRFNFADCKVEMKESMPIFASNIASNVYLFVVVMVLGYFASPDEVGKFSASDKIIRAIVTLLMIPLTQAFYPSVSRMASVAWAKARSLVNSLLMVEVAVMSFAIAAVFVISPYLPQWIGDDYAGTENIMRVLSVMALAMGISGVCGQLGLLAMGGGRQKNLFSKIYLAAFVLASIAVFVLVPQLQGMGAAIVIVIAEVFVATAMVVSYVRLVRR